MIKNGNVQIPKKVSRGSLKNIEKFVNDKQDGKYDLAKKMRNCFFFVF